MEILLTNQPAQRQRLLTALDAFAREHQLSASVRQAADLALEEHLANITNYAYENRSRHSIRVRLGVESGYLIVEVEDDGKPFDPLQVPPPNTSLPLEKKPVGGLGIHLIRKFMDDVHYRREADKNILRMRKRLDGSAG